MNMNPSTLTALQRQLRHFGLNPLEWDLVKRGTGHFLVVHRQEKQLALRGRARIRKAHAEWTSLSLASI